MNIFIYIIIRRIRDYWHRPDDVLAGLVLGAAAAHWSFRFVVMMPFDHEIGTPEWTPHPKWVEEEEKQWEKEEEAMVGCLWKGRRPKHARVRAMDDPSKASAQPTQVRSLGNGGLRWWGGVFCAFCCCCVFVFCALLFCCRGTRTKNIFVDSLVVSRELIRPRRLADIATSKGRTNKT